MTTRSTLTSTREYASMSNEATSSRQTYLGGREPRSSSTITRSRGGPSMFESASNFGIYGGRFTSQHAPQASVTVNINHGRINPDNANRYPHDTRHTTDARIGRNEPPSPRPNANPLESPLRPVQRSNVLYEQHLLHKGRGHPLWIPQPNLRLPIPYRAKGVSIGDVGIITPDGAFDFLFNICLPPRDPIHCEELPEDFVPINPPLSRTDVREFREFTDGSYLASASVAKVQKNQSESKALAFESSASEGAILTMPDGAYMEELNNISKFRDYISVHAETWYKFVNGPRGREVKNGDLRLVVGCDKTTSWGMAIFSNLYQQENFRLEFNARCDENGQVLPGNIYNWDHSGTAEVRTGPGAGENDELITGDDTISHPLRNQCLFVRTLNVKLSDALWEKLHPKPPVDVSLNEKTPSPSTKSQKSPRISPKVKPKLLKSSPTSGTRGGKRVEAPLPEKGSTSAEVIITSSPSSPATPHPADVLNEFLLKEVPEARMAITNDRDWFISSTSFSVFSNTADLILRVREMNNVTFKNGVVYFEPKGPDDDHQLEVLTSQVYSLIQGSISVEEYLFGQGEDTAEGIPKRRTDLLEDLQLESLGIFLADGVDLREYAIGRVTLGIFPTVIDVLEDLQKELNSGNVKVELLRSINDVTFPLPTLPGHPHRLLSLYEVIHLAGLPHAVHPPQSSPPDSETIETLRSRLDSYPTRFYIKTRIICMLRLSEALLRRFSQFHQIEDMHEAIFYYKEAITSTPLVSVLRLEASLGLCASLYQRIHLLGRLEDLRELVKVLKAQSLLDLSTLLKPVIDQMSDPPKKVFSFFNEARRSTTTLALPEPTTALVLPEPTTAVNPTPSDQVVATLPITSIDDASCPPKGETKTMRARIRRLTDATFRSTSGFLKKKLSRRKRARSLSKTNSNESLRFHSPTPSALRRSPTSVHSTTAYLFPDVKDDVDRSDKLSWTERDRIGLGDRKSSEGAEL